MSAEPDRGTEDLSRVVGKLAGYRRLVGSDKNRPVVFVLPSIVRERHLHDQPAMHPIGPHDGLIVATTTAQHLGAAGLSPADGVWWRPGALGRVRLIDLGWQW